MNEWGVVAVIITLVTFIIAIVKPVVALTKAISELTTVVGQLKTDVEMQRDQAKESHTKLWKHNTEQDKRIANLEREVVVIKALREE